MSGYRRLIVPIALAPWRAGGESYRYELSRTAIGGGVKKVEVRFLKAKSVKDAPQQISDLFSDSPGFEPSYVEFTSCVPAKMTDLILVIESQHDESDDDRGAASENVCAAQQIALLAMDLLLGSDFQYKKTYEFETPYPKPTSTGEAFATYPFGNETEITDDFFLKYGEALSDVQSIEDILADPANPKSQYSLIIGLAESYYFLSRGQDFRRKFMDLMICTEVLFKKDVSEKAKDAIGRFSRYIEETRPKQRLLENFLSADPNSNGAFALRNRVAHGDVGVSKDDLKIVCNRLKKHLGRALLKLIRERALFEGDYHSGFARSH